MHQAIHLIPFGARILVKPMIAIILKILLPTRLPTAISFSPRRLAITEVNTSGSDVPAAIIVSPIINSLTPKALAIATAAFKH